MQNQGNWLRLKSQINISKRVFQWELVQSVKTIVDVNGCYKNVAYKV